MKNTKELNTKKQCDIHVVGSSYIVRVSDQELCSGWIDKGGYSTPEKYIDGNGLLKDLKQNGLEVLKVVFSDFGACYFLEVRGNYIGSIGIVKLDTLAKNFDWNV